VRRVVPENTQIIIVDDFSTDGTREVLASEVRPLVSAVLLHERNMGKGAALRTGFGHTTGDIVIVQDADLEYDPNDYGKLLSPLLEHGADVVYGSRFIGTESHRVLFFWHSLANRGLTLLSNMFSNLNLTDMETGYKAFRGVLIRSLLLREDRFGFEPEVTLKLARRGCVFYEVGIAYHGRTYQEGKKIGLKDALRAFYCLVRYRIAD
jgi:glycosyltransferase involved in cell wall biosynthesis